MYVSGQHNGTGGGFAVTEKMGYSSGRNPYILDWYKTKAVPIVRGRDVARDRR